MESKANKQIKLVVVKEFENLERGPFARIYINIDIRWRILYYLSISLKSRR